MTYLVNIRNGGRNVPDFGKARTNHAANNQSGRKSPHRIKRRNTMHTMNASVWLDKLGAAFVNTVLIAALPTALVAILVQAF